MTPVSSASNANLRVFEGGKGRAEPTPPATHSVIYAVARVTFQEILRDKVLYNIGLFALLLLGVAALAANLTFIRPDRVVLDFGMGALNIASSLMAILIGAGMLSREFDRRTVFVVLSHPISKMQFLLGKFFGLAGMLVLNWGLLTAAFLVTLKLAGEDSANFHATLAIGIGLALLQSWMLAAFAILFSTFSTTSFAVIVSTGLYLIGNNVSQVRLIGAKLESPIASALVKALANLLPNLEYFNLGLKVTYGLPVTTELALYSVFYGIAVTSTVLAAAGWMLQTKEM